MNVKGPLLPLLLFVITIQIGCTRFMNESALSYESLPLKEESVETTCTVTKGQMSFASQHESGARLFFDRLISMRKRLPLAPIDEFVLWSLYQLNLSPFSATPQTRLQLMISINDQWRYWDAGISQTQNEHATPYLFVLQEMLAHYKSKHSLLQLARLLDQSLPQTIPISRTTALMLDKYQEDLKQNPLFQNVFFKAGQSLRPEETIPRLKLAELITKARTHLRNKDLYHIQNHLFTHERTQALCNFDPSIYDHGVYLVSLEGLEHSNPFLMTGLRGNQMLGVSGQFGDPRKNQFDTQLISTRKIPAPLAFCLTPTTQGPIVLMSTIGRDAAQLIYQYLDQLILQAPTAPDLDALLRGSRQLYLYNPDRVVFESNRERKNPFVQPRQDLPQYHAKAIGNIWGLHQDSQTQSISPLIDVRNEGVVSCQSK